MFISGFEETSKELDFKTNGMSVYGSCSFKLKGQNFVIGGNYNRNAVMKIKGCSIEVTSMETPESLYAHVCATLEDQNVAIICSPIGNKKKCYKLVVRSNG